MIHRNLVKQTTSICAAIFFWATCLASAQSSTDGDWKKSLAAVEAKAQSSKKDVAVFFVGPESSPPCKEMNASVLNNEEFRKILGEKFESLFILDPSDSAAVGKKMDGHKALRDQFKISSYPVMFLTNAGGKVYAEMSLQPDSLRNTLEKIAALRLKRDSLAKLLSVSTQKEGAADEGQIKVMAEALEDLGERIALTHYESAVNQVIAADADGTLGVSQVWKKRQESDQAMRQFGRIYAELAPILWNLKTSQEMVTLLDRQIVERKLEGELRQLIEMQKYRAWGMEKNYAKMLEAAEVARQIAPDSALAKRIPGLMARVKELQLNPVKDEQAEDLGLNLKEMPEVDVPEDALGGRAKQLTRFTKVYSSIEPELKKLNTPAEKSALIESTIGTTKLTGTAKQLMEMEIFKLWQSANNTEKMVESGEAAIATNPDSPIARRLKRLLAKTKKEPTDSTTGSIDSN